MAIYEIAISTISKEPLNGHQRVQEGDIVEIRTPRGYVGKKEMENFLWIKAELPEELVANYRNYTLDKTGTVIAGQRKFKFNIALDGLKTALPNFSVEKARDSKEKYQPFLGINTSTGLSTKSATVDLSNLITDKDGIK